MQSKPKMKRTVPSASQRSRCSVCEKSVSPRSSTLRKPPRKQVATATIEAVGGAFVRGPVARTIDDAQDFAGVGQGDDQRMITPDAVVGDVHACLHSPVVATRVPSTSMRASSKKSAGCCCQTADAHVIEDVLQEC